MVSHDRLYNGSFEVLNPGDSTLPDGWDRIITGTATALIDNVNSFTGARSVALYALNATSSAGIISDFFRVSADENYTPIIYAKNDVLNDNLYAEVLWYDLNQALISTVPLASPLIIGTTWTKKTVLPATPPSTDVAYARLRITNDPSRSTNPSILNIDYVYFVRLLESVEMANTGVAVGWYDRTQPDLAGRITGAYKETYSPLEFGAVGDGVVDDTAALASMIASVPDGSVIALRGKKFGISSQLLISGKRLIIEGDGGAFVQTGANTYLLPLVSLTDADESILRDLNIVGNETLASYETSAGVTRIGIDVNSSDAVILEGVRVVGIPPTTVAGVTTYYGKSYGVRLLNSNYCTVDDLYVRGFMVTPPPTRDPVSCSGLYVVNYDTWVEGPPHTWTLTTPAGGWHSIKGLDTQDTGSGYVQIGDSKHNTLLNARVRNTWDNGIYISGGRYMSVIGAQVVTSNGTGVKLRGQYHRAKGCNVKDVAAGFACSGAGATGKVVGIPSGDNIYYPIVDVGTFDHYGAPITYCGIGHIFEDCTAVNTKADGLEVQDRVKDNDGGGNAYPYDCSFINMRLINTIIDGPSGANAGNYAALIRGHHMRVDGMEVTNYMGTSQAVYILGLSNTERALGMQIHNVKVNGAPGQPYVEGPPVIAADGAVGIKVVYMDESELSECSVMNVTSYGIAMDYCSSNRVIHNSARYGITGTGLYINPATTTTTDPITGLPVTTTNSRLNLVDGNDVSSLSVDYTAQEGGNNFINGVRDRLVATTVTSSTSVSTGTAALSATLNTGVIANSNALTWTARTTGTTGNAITVALLNSGASRPLAVIVTGNDISVQLATDGSSVITSTATEVRTAVAASTAANTLVTVANQLGSSGGQAIAAFAATSLAGGTNAVGGQVKAIGPAGTSRELDFYTDNSIRWQVRANTTAEVPVTNTKVGSNFEIRARDDFGVDFGRALLITRSSLLTTLNSLSISAPAMEAVTLAIGDWGDISLGTNHGTKIGTATTQKLGIWGATPIVRPSGYTQTYTVADKTHSAYTANSQSAAYTGAADGEAKLADLNALRAAYENLRAFAEDTAQLANAIIDDLQAIGLVG